ncbi:MAG TPA: enoyl-CoA hydratase/isomerase family protein [Casimicrobiaceae bacterium]|nr:enoyl-CoA hydratase/isomerase family protein [Casimicrobiaceae bacterium]
MATNGTTTTGAWTTLEVAQRDGVRMVGLARPRIHNAFDEVLITELTEAFRQADEDPAVRAVLLHASGPSFCAGADLEWMRRVAGYGRAENLADAHALAAMLSAIATCGKPTLARVQGNAFGGGVGLIACCDIAIGSSEAIFALSEVKLGIIPATIGPYVLAAIGARQARRYFVSGERFDAAEAQRIGLLHEVVAPSGLGARTDAVLDALMLAGPRAQREAKLLLRAISGRPIDGEVIADPAERIARVRATDEAREGVGAFLEKRRPAWMPAKVER